MNKYVNVTACAAVLICQAACNSGGGSSGTTPTPNSITGTAVAINSNWNGGSSTIQNITSGSSSGLSAVSEGIIWQADYVAGQNLVWESLPVLPDSSVVSATAVTTSNGALYAASSVGAAYSYNDGWVSHSTTGESLPTTMTLSTGNHVYLGNAEGHLWYYTDASGWEDNLSANGFTPSVGGITQVILDNPANPLYLGVATGPNVWACQLSSVGGVCSAWKNLTSEAGSAYTDSGSHVNAMGFYQTTSGTQYDYGYIGNAAGHVWRAIYQTNTSTVNTFYNMNTTYPGFPSNAGEITSLAVDANNNVYAGTSKGYVEIWTTGTTAWSNITPQNNTSPVTALSVISSTTTNGVLVVGNSAGKIWSIDWK